MSVLQTHLSRRAHEWLTKAKTIYGNSQVYRAGVGEAACGVEHQYLRLCSTEDVRALYLGMDYKVVFNERSSASTPTPGWLRRPVKVITCNDCRVLFDKACDEAPRKEGQWLEIDEKGFEKWVQPKKEKRAR